MSANLPNRETENREELIADISAALDRLTNQLNDVSTQARERESADTASTKHVSEMSSRVLEELGAEADRLEQHEEWLDRQCEGARVAIEEVARALRSAEEAITTTATSAIEELEKWDTRVDELIKGVCAGGVQVAEATDRYEAEVVQFYSRLNTVHSELAQSTRDLGQIISERAQLLESSIKDWDNTTQQVTSELMTEAQNHGNQLQEVTRALIDDHIPHHMESLRERFGRAEGAVNQVLASDLPSAIAVPGDQLVSVLDSVGSQTLSLVPEIDGEMNRLLDAVRSILDLVNQIKPILELARQL